MKHRVVLAFLILVYGPASAQSKTWKDVKEDVASGIVRMHVVYEDRERSRPYREGDLETRMGTGFFINSGQLVTNEHVLEGARSIKIEGVATKEKFAVRLASAPSLRFDLAVLEFVNSAERERFERTNGPIRALQWADWSEAQPGEQVAVLGFGFSDQLVATQGIISSWEARHDIVDRRLDHTTLIRTDASLNPGNSGGPVVSAAGRVVGISARYRQGENIGLLIPFNTARRVVEVMLTEGRFTETDPGLVTYNLNPVLRDRLDLAPEQGGLVVSRVLPDSPAELAGIRQWDVLTAVNGYTISHGEIRHEHAGKVPYWFLFNVAPPGTQISFEVLRDNLPSKVQVVLAPLRVPRVWLPVEGDDYEPQWGTLGGLVITEVTRGLLEEIEASGNWRWDLVNDAPHGGKIYLVSHIEPGTQAMTYQEYGLDVSEHRVLAIDGVALAGNFEQQLDRLYDRIEAGMAPPTITVDFENNISIQLDSAALLADLQVLRARYPAVSRPASREVWSAPATAEAGATHRWSDPSQGEATNNEDRPEENAAALCN